MLIAASFNSQTMQHVSLALTVCFACGQSEASYGGDDDQTSEQSYLAQGFPLVPVE